MEINESSIMTALGLEGENVQEPAAPASESVNTGEQVQEPAEPAAQAAVSEDPSAAGTPETDGAADNTSGDSADTQDTMTPQQRHENAARRRNAEKQAEIDKAVEAAVAAEREKNRAQMQSFFDSAKLKNTVTGKPINSMEDFEAWKSDYANAQLDRDLKAGELTADKILKVVESHPAVKAAQQIVEAEKAQKNAAARASVEASIAKIHEKDASIGSMNDLLAAPNAKEIYALVRKGYDVYDAWATVNRDKLEAATQHAAAEAAYQKQAGKSHLTPLGTSRGSGAASVPHDEMALFRTFMPEASEADFQAYYNNYLNR